MDLGNLDFGNVILIAASVLTGIGLLWLATLALPRRRHRNFQRAEA